MTSEKDHVSNEKETVPTFDDVYPEEKKDFKHFNPNLNPLLKKNCHKDLQDYFQLRRDDVPDLECFESYNGSMNLKAKINQSLKDFNGQLSYEEKARMNQVIGLLQGGSRHRRRTNRRVKKGKSTRRRRRSHRYSTR
jgi:hypothetical protein